MEAVITTKSEKDLLLLYNNMHHHRYSNADFCLDLVHVVINILHSKCVDYPIKTNTSIVEHYVETFKLQ